MRMDCLNLGRCHPRLGRWTSIVLRNKGPSSLVIALKGESFQAMNKHRSNQLLPRFKNSLARSHTADFLNWCFWASKLPGTGAFWCTCLVFSQKPSRLDSFSSDLSRHLHGTMVRHPSHGGSVGGTCRPPSQTAADRAQWPGVSRLPAAAGCNGRRQVETLCHVPTPLERSKTLWEGEKTEEGEETGWSLVIFFRRCVYFFRLVRRRMG